jgi:transposase
MTAQSVLNQLMEAYVQASVPVLAKHHLPLTQDMEVTIDPSGATIGGQSTFVPDYWSYVTRVEPELLALPETDALLNAIGQDVQLQKAFLTDGSGSLWTAPQRPDHLQSQLLPEKRRYLNRREERRAMGRGRVHSREFKLAAVRQVASGEKRPAQVYREHGIGEGLLLRWRREYEARGEDAFVPHAPSETETLERRIAELERLCGQLALENAVLKGALRGFRSPSAMR